MAALDQIVGAKIRQGIVVDAEPRALRHIGVTNIPKTEPGITDLMQSLDRLCAHITLDVFTTAGLDTQWRTVEELGSELGIASRHETLFSEMSRILIRAGYAEPNGQAMRLGAKVIDIPSFNTMAARIEKKHPRIAPHIRLLKACADKYTDVLSGRLPATEAIFPNGDTSLAEAIYGDTPFTAPGNRQLAEVLSDIVSTGEANILEVGAGTGATTAVALDTLRQAKTPFRYCYTDIAHALLMAGKRRFGESDDLEYRLFDLNAPCAEQGFQPNSFDVVIASNVLHTAPDLDEALRNITESIAPGGTLIIIELTRVMAFNTMIFGLLDEWWAPANHPERLPRSEERCVGKEC